MREPVFPVKSGPHPYALAAATSDENHSARDWLEKRELALWSSFGSPRRKEQFLLGRIAAKRALNTVAKGHAPRETALLPGYYGQPVWCDLPWLTSLTHSGDGKRSIAIAVTGSPAFPITLDLEPLNSDASRLRSLRQRLPADERSDHPTPENAIIGAWSAKECLGKALGTGIGVAPEVLALRRTKSGPTKAVYHFKSLPQFQVTQWKKHGWLLSLLSAKGSAVPPGLSAWFASVVR